MGDHCLCIGIWDVCIVQRCSATCIRLLCGLVACLGFMNNIIVKGTKSAVSSLGAIEDISV